MAGIELGFGGGLTLGDSGLTLDGEGGGLGDDTGLPIDQEARDELELILRTINRGSPNNNEDPADLPYWFAVAFQNRKQKEEFLDKFGHELGVDLLDIGDKYFSGRQWARLLGFSDLSGAPSLMLAGDRMAEDDDRSSAGIDADGIDLDADDDLSESLRAFKDASSREEDRFLDAVDGEFWIAVAFASAGERTRFLDALQGRAKEPLRAASTWVHVDHADEVHGLYFGGMAFAQALGIRLETPFPEMREFRHNPKLIALSVRDGQKFGVPPDLSIKPKKRN